MTSRTAAHQHGVALLGLVALLIMAALWWLVAVLGTPASRTALERNRNAEVLQQARSALVGYVAQQAADLSENNPGRLPCPEAAGSVGNPATEGTAAGNCTLPAVGRLPWRTLGLPKPRDAAGEPLWYVVSPGWALTNASLPPLTTSINSNSTGQLLVDGTAAVALIIAPGPPLDVQASANCAARSQARQAPSPAIDFRNYLECQNATSPADTAFATSGPDGSFNDQVVSVTAADVLPAIEAAVATRFERQFASQMRIAYSTGSWPATPVLPFAVPFGDPSASPANKFQGGAGVMQGLMPVGYGFTGPCACGPTPCTCALAACDPAADARCDPAFVAWSAGATTVTRTGGAQIGAYGCSVAGTPTTLTCNIDTYFTPAELSSGTTWVTFNLDAVATNAGMALRKVNAPPTAPAIAGIDSTYVNSPIGYNVTSATLNTDGSATVRVNARLPAGGGSVLGALGAVTCDNLGTPLCYRHTISVPMGLFSDHPVVDPSNATYNWFYRNNWHQVSYYAVAPGIAPSGARSCVSGTSCLSVAYASPGNTQRGLIVIAGRALGAQVRPPLAASDLLEDVNGAGGTAFTARVPTLMINRSFNDRIAVIDAN